MTIDIQQPELESFLRSQMETGRFESVEDVLLEALHLHANRPPAIHVQPQASQPRPNLAQFLMDSPLSGSGLCLERIRDYPRTVKL